MKPQSIPRAPRAVLSTFVCLSLLHCGSSPVGSQAPGDTGEAGAATDSGGGANADAPAPDAPAEDSSAADAAPPAVDAATDVTVDAGTDGTVDSATPADAVEDAVSDVVSEPAPLDAAADTALPWDAAVTGSQHVLASGDYHSCVLKAGHAYCWGANDVGQLGNGTLSDANAPVAVTGPGVGLVSLSARFAATCAVDVNGGIWCWGGAEVAGPAFNSVTMDPVSVSLPGPAATVAVGDEFACALLVDGRVFCWGVNGWGQFGLPISAGTQPPTLMPLSGPATDLGAGESFTCVHTASGVACMGEDSDGELGDGTLSGGWTVPRPVLQIGTTIATLSVGIYHSCAITTTASAACWGLNVSEEVGPSGYGDDDTPYAVPALAASPVLVGEGGFHTCMLTADSVLSCWGANYHGALGRGTDTSQELIGPVTSAPQGISDIAPGRYHSCVLEENKGAWCWGDNARGQLGVGPNVPFATTPQLVGP